MKSLGHDPIQLVLVVAEQQRRPVPLLSRQTADGPELALAVPRKRGEVLMSQRSSQIATVTAHDIRTVVGADPNRLVPGGVAFGHKTHDRPVAEQILVTIQLPSIVAEVDVGWIDRATRHQTLVAELGPLPPLHHHSRPRKVTKPAGVIEVEMRQHHMCDRIRPEASTPQRRRQRVATIGIEVWLEDRRETTQPVLLLRHRRMQASVDHDQRRRMLDHVHHDQVGDEPGLALQEAGPGRGHRTRPQRVHTNVLAPHDLERHRARLDR